MATYGEVKTQFTSLLNRRDITPTQITTFLQNAIGRIQRNLRVPAMEQSVEIVIPSGYAGLSIPADYLQLIRIVNVRGEELERTDFTTASKRAECSGVPKVYARQGSMWVLGPEPQAGDTVRIDYHAQFNEVSGDSDENLLTIIAPDLIVYGALIYAGQHFNDRRLPGWQQSYETAFVELQDQGDRDELLNAVVSPAYAIPTDQEDY